PPPLIEKLTGWPTTGWPLVPLTWTISGAGKFWLAWVLCESPDTFVSEAICTLVLRVNVVAIPLLLARAALTEICPTALALKLTVVCACPLELVVVELEVKVAPAPVRVQLTAVLAIVTAPEASVTLTTSGAEAWAGLTV